ncbi:penicillin-binding protein 2 [Yoonia sediminilitoris]|uniref:Peptidoglycan glycosyltransferase n=1 Tax=Yoonia sediminilitoris TaxID=1286148 RepID=A0A2T6KKD3_9RHOB|nr:penicillin-binding protein 2 [Yoonia sediminilitoris]PUB16421.1 peptidoglycan glycosyltransferase [Yoonia sediminilitoris]RCW96770.1 peptidoglycan glycosyltransferase [Yoonia sediminilitoris]
MKRSPKDVMDSARTISRRALVMGGVQLGVVGVLGWRLQSMQVEQADQFRLLAEENRINIRLLPPARGLIFDRNGIPIADNEQNYRVVMVREDAGDIGEVLARLTRLVDIDPDDLTRAMDEMQRRSPFVPVTIADRLSWEDVAQINLNTPTLPGITAEVGLSRVYPAGADLAHVVGYVGPVSDYDLSRIDDSDPLLQIPKFQIGKSGAENKLERTLRGSAGTRRIEVNAAGRIMRELDRKEGEAGKDIQLTLDSRLQTYVQARLEGQSAGAVVIDLENGDLRAVASAPAFDPNKFVRGISVKDWTDLNDNKYRPLAAKAVQGAYPPGSTFKMVTALAAFEAGVVAPDETVYCPGYTDVYGIRFHCWKRGGHGNINLHESLKQSCDCYYYEIAQRVGIDKMAEMARKLGLGIKHDLPLSAVAQGLAPDKAWKSTVRGEEWRIGDTVNASIGQGYVLASPLQLAVLSARIATGREVTPRLIRLINGVEQPSGMGDSLGINENTLRRVRASMNDVCNHRRGTAYRSRILAEGQEMAGKTGTSQVRRITPEERAAGVTKNEDLPWERRDHALFVSFAPYDNPRYALSVVVEHGGGGSSAAAPIARDIMLQALYGGPPPLEAYPSADRDRIAEQQKRIEARIPPGARSRSQV